ncbi:MAG: adenylate kinase [Chloroflexota bacterium]|nr:adenylate kinase [Chloroflexota bacterium]
MSGAATSTSTNTNKNALFFGPQGVGKGTQATIVAPRLRLAHVSTGDLFRRNIAEQTALGQQVAPILDAGLLVPDTLTIAMLDDHLITLRQAAPELRGVIFDGFPRTVAQVESLDAFLRSRGEQVDAVVYIDAPRPVLVERIFSRGRADDTREAAEERLRLYEEKTQPLLSLFERRGIIHRINGNQPIEAVTAEIIAALAPIFEGSTA